MLIQRHAIERTRIEKRLSDASEDLPIFLEGARRDPTNLSTLISTAMDVAKCGSVVGQNMSEVRIALRLAGQASAALFLTAATETFPVEIAIGDGPPAVYTTRPDESTVDALEWLRGFFLNVVCRDSSAINIMCRAPTALLRSSTTKNPEYRYLYVDAVKRFWSKEADCSKSILAALEATDPDRGDVRSPNWALWIDVPQLQMLFYVNAEDDEFATEFPKAVELHRQYWSATKKRREDWDGFLAVELIGLAALANDRNMEFEIDSEYVPMELVRP